MRHNSSQPNPYDPAQAGMSVPVPAPTPIDAKQARKDEMKRQMMAQILNSKPFQNPQMIPLQFQAYSNG